MSGTEGVWRNRATMRATYLHQEGAIQGAAELVQRQLVACDAASVVDGLSSRRCRRSRRRGGRRWRRLHARSFFWREAVVLCVHRG